MQPRPFSKSLFYALIAQAYAALAAGIHAPLVYAALAIGYLFLSFSDVFDPDGD